MTKNPSFVNTASRIAPTRQQAYFLRRVSELIESDPELQSFAYSRLSGKTTALRFLNTMLDEKALRGSVAPVLTPSP